VWKNREKRWICEDFVRAGTPTALNIGAVIP
jgi:hypothetical protein